MYAQLSSQMIRAHQAELERRSLAAQHRRAIQEARGDSPLRATRIRWTKAVSARLVRLGVRRDATLAPRTHVG